MINFYSYFNTINEVKIKSLITKPITYFKMKLEDYMLPCLNKKMFGIDCPGCGLQRSMIFITKGNFKEAFSMYPAIYTLILFGAFIVYNYFSKNKINSKIIYSLGILNVIIILTNYFNKLF